MEILVVALKMDLFFKNGFILKTEHRYLGI
jgi:hypothetical protein